MEGSQNSFVSRSCSTRWTLQVPRDVVWKLGCRCMTVIVAVSHNEHLLQCPNPSRLMPGQTCEFGMWDSRMESW